MCGQRHHHGAGSTRRFGLDLSAKRAVEVVLLNGAVRRFDDGVHTQQLRLAADDLRLKDIERVDAEIAYCSGFVHDRARATPARPPAPDIVESDIKKLDDWAKEIRARRKKKGGARSRYGTAMQVGCLLILGLRIGRKFIGGQWFRWAERTILNLGGGLKL